MTALALFDFDGTITTKDTLLEFIKFCKGKSSFYKGLLILSPILVLFKLKLIKNWRAKEIMLGYFFKGTPVREFEDLCNRFAEEEIPKLLRPKAVGKLREHQNNGDHIVVVSASVENWIRPWSKKQGFELLGTKLEIVDGKISGKIKGVNCYGPEKVARVKAYLQSYVYQRVYAYGDSGGDRELLKYATHPHYRFFSLTRWESLYIARLNELVRPVFN